ncbi:protein of unknown function DUF323 [Chloroherpeton thalassium ATCC 35110]|uniref:Sulfatase-modifying factor enzyme domain-containing protein n=1 Tax=Chloroherpeton thalassium (strain ATCC 35110 / GB-78) TaxID=517418 RepID=B3QWM6_CHLT3|nr:SUMF1/EgtB/PvdO family nonheme iron enzyme [Chloroherpeton thalassium]ACF14786.1 protein of unknown function DUF323 [Chloroherpeton thalassium ATCC 35110]
MKNILLVLLMLTAMFAESGAQTAKMHIDGKPEKLTNEMVGVRDVNGRLCAALQFVSDMDGFKYDSYNGVVRVDDEPGRDMVFVSPDERVVEVFKTGYEPLQIILSEYGIQLNAKEVWKIKIVGDAKRAADALPVSVLVQPVDAEIKIGGNMAKSGKPIKLSKGKYEIVIRKKGYKTRKDSIAVDEKHVLFNYTLSEVDLQTVTITSEPTQADLFINGLAEGKTDKGLFLYPGEYGLKLSKSGYMEVSEQISVEEGAENRFHYKLVKNVGVLSLKVNPADARVLINRKDYTGQTSIELAPGSYKLEISKTDYEEQSETISLERGERLQKNYALKAKTGRLQFSIQPLTAKVTLKRDGTVVEKWEGLKYLKALQTGDYELECQADGYATVKQKLTIRKGKTEALEITMQEGVAPAGDMVFVKGGTFMMGSYDEDDEKPVHQVTVSDFYIGKYEVTQKEWKEIMGSNPSYFKGDDRPVERVSWNAVQEFIRKLNKKTGENYRLPTEAEWEYAARGGANSRGYEYAGSNNIDEVAWYDKNACDKGSGHPDYGTHPVGGKKPNELGIYDMSGNVWELCSDWYGDYSSSSQTNPTGPSSGSDRVCCGGCWFYFARLCQVVSRNGITPTRSGFDLGFRLVVPR